MPINSQQPLALGSLVDPGTKGFQNTPQVRNEKGLGPKTPFQDNQKQDDKAWTKTMGAVKRSPPSKHFIKGLMLMQNITNPC